MPRWIILAGVYALANSSGILLAELLAENGVISPPDALDVLEFFTWGGPPLLAIGQALLLAHDRAKWHQWPMAIVVVGAVAYWNYAFLVEVYGSI